MIPKQAKGDNARERKLNILRLVLNKKDLKNVKIEYKNPTTDTIRLNGNIIGTIVIINNQISFFSV